MTRPISRPRRKPGPKPDPNARPTAVVTARVDADLAAWLDQEAAALERSRSELIEAALREAQQRGQHTDQEP
jgi:uncharacterized protein (DUF1778 family)